VPMVATLVAEKAEEPEMDTDKLDICFCLKILNLTVSITRKGNSNRLHISRSE